MIIKERGVPKPPLKEVKYKDLKPMMIDLKVTECLFYPCEDNREIKAVRTKYNYVKARIKYVDKLEHEFSTRKCEDGLRIWRDK
jgi:hypothetical protein